MFLPAKYSITAAVWRAVRLLIIRRFDLLVFFVVQLHHLLVASTSAKYDFAWCSKWWSLIARFHPTIIWREMISTWSKLPSAAVDTPMVVHCISLRKRRGCVGASKSFPTNDDSSAICSGFIVPSIFFSPKTCTSGISPSLSWPSPTSSSVSMSVVPLNTEHGCCGCDRVDDRRWGKPYGGGGCRDKSSCLDRIISAQIVSVSSWGQVGRRGSKYAYILQYSGPSTEYACPWVLHCLSTSFLFLSKPLFLLQAASFSSGRRWSILSNLWDTVFSLTRVNLCARARELRLRRAR